ncbi:Rubrerythrin [Methanosarcina barkeri str. Wiesmoor]|uniref:Rubrerythrin n=1 Tax=Methanosarcina barkeri str. Wiesmoor TaxID=1434109 RepID=A0A0E3QKH6_METBA|nr:Rubrerythrin [Methanosarcina barkeri str. Wiesmoor]
MGDTGIFLAAMRHERKSEDFYLKLASYELIDNYLDYVTNFRMQT